MSTGDGEAVGRAVTNSLMCMAGATVSTMLISRFIMDHKWSCIRGNNGSLAGLV